jgi:hypothetical protein
MIRVHAIIIPFTVAIIVVTSLSFFTLSLFIQLNRFSSFCRCIPDEFFHFYVAAVIPGQFFSIHFPCGKMTSLPNLQILW